jgi:hypothetical protein
VDACLQLRCLATDFLQLRVFARIGPHRKHIFLSIVACIRVYRAVAWQRVDQTRYNILIRSSLSLSVFIPVAPSLEHRASVERFVSLQFLNPKTVGKTPWPGDQRDARPLTIQDNTNRE